MPTTTPMTPTTPTTTTPTTMTTTTMMVLMMHSRAWSLEGLIVLLYVHSHMNKHVCQIWCRLVHQFSSFPRRFFIFYPIFDHLKSPKIPPGVTRGYLFLAYVHSQMDPHVYLIWTQSVQPFGHLPQWGIEGLFV